MAFHFALLVPICFMGCTKDPVEVAAFPGLPVGASAAAEFAAQGYTSACQAATVRYFGMAIEASTGDQRQYFEDIAGEFSRKGSNPDAFSVTFFTDLLRDFKADLRQVFGSAEAGMEVFNTLVAAHEFSKTPHSIKHLLIRTFNRVVLKPRPVQRLPDLFIKAYMAVMTSVIPQSRSEAVAVHHLELQFSNIETAVSFYSGLLKSVYSAA